MWNLCIFTLGKQFVLINILKAFVALSLVYELLVLEIEVFSYVKFRNCFARISIIFFPSKIIEVPVLHYKRMSSLS
jgi:hypothetical protein